MRDNDNCICCTENGNCTENLHDEIINKKRVQVGLRECPVFHGKSKGCILYQSSTYYHRDILFKEDKK
jgi:hypothetical protein